MHTLADIEPHLTHDLSRETIQGIPCFVLGSKVVPIRAIGPAIPRDQADELVTVRGGVYHVPGCRHWDTGDRLVGILVALDCGFLPCSAVVRRAA
jgi:hypothetical protein